MTDFASLPGIVNTNLERLAIAVRDVLPLKTKSWNIRTRDLAESGDEPALVGEVKNWAGNGGRYLYTISRESSDPSNENLANSFAHAKASEKGERAYARLNLPSSCIYVGSSGKIHQRIKEHLGYGAKGTYSLQLSAWATSLGLDLELRCAQYPANTPPDVLQVLEDALWSQLRPMFGRQGAR